MLPELRSILTSLVASVHIVPDQFQSLQMQAKHLSNWNYIYSRESRLRNELFDISPSQISTRAMLKSVIAKTDFKRCVTAGAEDSEADILSRRAGNTRGLALTVDHVIDQIERDCNAIKSGKSRVELSEFPLIESTYLITEFEENLSPWRKSESAPHWQFWKDWYQGFLDGKPIDWDLQLRIALDIEDGDWEAGPERVAQRIKEIRKEFNASETPTLASIPKLEAKSLTRHVKKLLSAPKMTEMAAESMAGSIEQAVSEYLTAAPANCLPEELEHLNHLPSAFRRIAKVVQSKDKTEIKVQAMAKEIQSLNVEIARLEAALKLANEKTLHGRFKINTIETAGKVFGSLVWLPPLALGTCHFFGIQPSDVTFENLRVWLDSMPDAEPLLEPRPSTWETGEEV